MMFLKKEEVNFIEVDEFDNKNCRGTKGFGSTGIKNVYNSISRKENV